MTPIKKILFVNQMENMGRIFNLIRYWTNNYTDINLAYFSSIQYAYNPCLFRGGGGRRRIETADPRGQNSSDVTIFFSIFFWGISRICCIFLSSRNYLFFGVYTEGWAYETSERRSYFYTVLMKISLSLERKYVTVEWASKIL